MINKVILLILLLPFTAFAQYSNVVVFTQEPSPFTVILNGVQQNPEPETNVKVTGLNPTSYKIKILFQDAAIPALDKAIFLEPDTETTFEILKNSKGVIVLRMLNTVPIDEAPERSNNQEIYVYTTTPRVSSTTVTQTTTLNTGIPGVGSITTTTTQTTTSHGHQEETGGTIYHDEQGGYDDGYRRDYPDYPRYNGPHGCPRPMSKYDFEQALNSIESKSFESSKLTIAKQVVSANCLLSRQVKQMMKLFTFESDKLEFAKYAYRYTWDINNYFMLNDVFEFESSIDELNDYINSRK